MSLTVIIVELGVSFINRAVSVNQLSCQLVLKPTVDLKHLFTHHLLLLPTDFDLGLLLHITPTLAVRPCHYIDIINQ